MKNIYIVVSEWQDDEIAAGGHDIQGAFLKKEDAINCLNKILEEQTKNTSLGQDPDTILEQDEDSFSMYGDGEYFGNHFDCEIITIELK